jgi:hypothetical protein
LRVVFKKQTQAKKTMTKAVTKKAQGTAHKGKKESVKSMKLKTKSGAHPSIVMVSPDVEVENHVDVDYVEQVDVDGDEEEEEEEEEEVVVERARKQKKLRKHHQEPLEAWQKELKELKEDLRLLKKENKEKVSKKEGKDKKKSKKRSRDSSSESDSSEASSDESTDSDESSDGFEEDLEVLKPLVPKSWANSKARFKRDLAALKEDICAADPKRPQFLIDELDLVISLAVAIHKDGHGKGMSNMPTAGAKIFQYVASAYCRAHGAQAADLKTSLAKLKRSERKSSKKLINAVRKAMGKAKSKGKPAQHQQQGGGFRSKKQFSTFSGTTSAVAAAKNAEAAKDGRKT